MKTRKTFGYGITALAAVIGFTMIALLLAACDNGGGGGGTKTYTVSFNANGGSGTVPSQTVEPGDSITLPDGSGLSKSGFLFSGWNTKADGTGDDYSAGDSFTPTGSSTLYAKWGNSYTVSFDSAYGTGTVPPVQTVAIGSSITLPNGSGLSWSGYALAGWNTEYDGTGTNYGLGSSYTPSGNIAAIILYAKWEVTTYTITFSANRGSGTVPVQTVQPGGSITLPNGNFSLAYAEFTGWNTEADGTGAAYAAGSSYTPTGNWADIFLYAQWNITTPFASVTGFEEKLKWLEANAQSNTSYTVEANADESISPKVFSGGRSGVTITLKGVGANRTVSLSSKKGTMFTVYGLTLVLDNNLTLQCRDNTEDKTVSVNDGTLIMNTGSAISGNGRGVYVSFGTFTMNGGTISGNTGGGVYVGRGTFTMSGGTISDNTGSGVYVGSETTFTMSGGTISGNTSRSYGGGVYVGSGTFTMNGGEISGNAAYYSNNVFSFGGGGVYVDWGTTFTMNGGTISGNTSANPYHYVGGGGVLVAGTFTMSGGTISGNTGGGVQVGDCYRNGYDRDDYEYVHLGTFTMSGGTISGNTTDGNGGGVYVYCQEKFRNYASPTYTSATFDKTGGTIYGYSDTDNDNRGGQGHAVAVDARIGKYRRNTTAGPTVNLYCGGTTFSGAWEE